MGIGDVLAIISVVGLIATIGCLVYMLMRAQAFIMMSTSPHAAVEIMKSVHEKRYDKAEKKKASDEAKKHERYKHMVARGEATEAEIAEFGIQLGAD